MQKSEYVQLNSLETSANVASEGFKPTVEFRLESCFELRQVRRLRLLGSTDAES